MMIPFPGVRLSEAEFESRDRAGKARRLRLHWLVVKNGIVAKRLPSWLPKAIQVVRWKTTWHSFD
jgi:hypothetical protein